MRSRPSLAILFPAAALFACSAVPAPGGHLGPQRSLATVDVRDAAAYAEVVVLDAGGQPVMDVRFSLMRAGIERVLPLHGAVGGSGHYFVGLDRGAPYWSESVWMVASSAALGTTHVPVSADSQRIELQFHEPVRYDLGIDGEDPGSLRASLARVLSGSGVAAPSIDTVARRVGGDSTVELGPLQPGTYELEVVRIGSSSPWDGEEVVVARESIMVMPEEAGVRRTDAVQAASLHRVAISVNGLGPIRQLGVRPLYGAQGQGDAQELVVQVPDSRRVTLHGLAAGEYSLRNAQGGAAVVMAVPNDGFEFLQPKVAGQRVIPKTRAADISPFRAGDVVVRVGQGGVTAHQFESYLSLALAMDGGADVDVVNAGERRRFRLDSVPRGVMFLPVSTDELTGFD